MPSTPDDLASRIRQARLETYGEDGTTDLAEALGLPARTWRNFEDGVRIPGEVLLRFLPGPIVRGHQGKPSLQVRLFESALLVKVARTGPPVADGFALAGCLFLEAGQPLLLPVHLERSHLWPAA